MRKKVNFWLENANIFVDMKKHSARRGLKPWQCQKHSTLRHVMDMVLTKYDGCRGILHGTVVLYHESA